MRLTRAQLTELVAVRSMLLTVYRRTWPCHLLSAGVCGVTGVFVIVAAADVIVVVAPLVIVVVGSLYPGARVGFDSDAADC